MSKSANHLTSMSLPRNMHVTLLSRLKARTTVAELFGSVYGVVASSVAVLCEVPQTCEELQPTCCLRVATPSRTKY